MTVNNNKRNITQILKPDKNAIPFSSKNQKCRKKEISSCISSQSIIENRTDTDNSTNEVYELHCEKKQSKINDFINQIICGECTQVIKTMPAECIDLVISSPPYDGLRKYDGYDFDYRSIIESLWYVIKPGGVVVWVVGDATINGSETGTSYRQALAFKEVGFKIHDSMIYEKNSSSFPARRESNRYTQIFEFMFVFSKGKPKTANLICDKRNRWAGSRNWGENTHRDSDGKLIQAKKIKPVPEYSPRNNIWKYNTGRRYSAGDNLAYGHPAVFPEKLVADHILTWSNEGDLVLDPLVGSGTVPKIAKYLNRDFIGIDISEEYCKLARRRLNTPVVKGLVPRCNSV
jgi:DNA modification methylase